MARQIEIESLEQIEIKDPAGNVTGCFYWNPADLDIIKRYDEVQKRFEEFEVPAGEDADQLMALSDEIKLQFDYLLNSNASEALFAKCNPLSPRPNGEFYAEYVLGILAKFIESEMKVRMNKSTARIKKYTEKYGR